jgi:hypothetical protein
MAVRFSALGKVHPLPQGRFLVLISVRGWVDPRVIVWLEELGQLKSAMTSWWIEPATFKLVPYYAILFISSYPTGEISIEDITRNDLKHVVNPVTIMYKLLQNSVSVFGYNNLEHSYLTFVKIGTGWRVTEINVTGLKCGSSAGVWSTRLR